MRLLSLSALVHACILAAMPTMRGFVWPPVELNTTIDVEWPEPPQDEPVRASSPEPVRHASPRPVGPGEPPPPAARAAPVLVAPEAPETVVTDVAPDYPGGTTQKGATSPDPQPDPRARAWGVVGGNGTGGGGWGLPKPVDLSAPARLGGTKRWACRTGPGALPGYVRVRALVDHNGKPLHVELAGDEEDRLIFRAALPCAMRERYQPGLDRNGKVTTAWTVPFRIVVATE